MGGLVVGFFSPTVPIKKEYIFFSGELRSDQPVVGWAPL
jgi:hypothetical protein